MEPASGTMSGESGGAFGAQQEQDRLGWNGSGHGRRAGTGADDHAGSPPISPNLTSGSHSPRFPPSAYPGKHTQLTADGPRAPSRASYGGSLFGKGNRRVSRAPTIIPRSQAVRVEDLVQSGERIFARYLVGGAEKEIYLP